jgi:RHS repeat-associated protein
VDETNDPLHLDQPYLFTGKEFDVETGLYYFGARYYDPRLSLWTTADPILGNLMHSGPNSVQLALYTYAGNNPIGLFDPDGRDIKVKGSFEPRKIVKNVKDGIPKGAVAATASLASYSSKLRGAYDSARNVTTLSLDITVTLNPSVTSYPPGVEPGDKDPYVPSRTVDQHEKGHITVGEQFYTKENLERALSQVGVSLELEAPGNLANDDEAAGKLVAAGKARISAATEYLKAYRGYLDDRIMHTQAREAYPTPEPPPSYIDPVTKIARQPSQVDLDAMTIRMGANVKGAYRPKP